MPTETLKLETPEHLQAAIRLLQLDRQVAVFMTQHATLQKQMAELAQQAAALQQQEMAEIAKTFGVAGAVPTRIEPDSIIVQLVGRGNGRMEPEARVPDNIEAPAAAD